MEPMEDDRTVPVDAGKLAADTALVEERLWDKVRRTLGRVPFVEDAVAAYFCATDRATPLYVKAILMGALAYFIIPADVIPDLIVGLGYTDDASVLAAALAAVRNNLTPEHRARARGALKRQEADAED